MSRLETQWRVCFLYSSDSLEKITELHGHYMHGCSIVTAVEWAKEHAGIYDDFVITPWDGDTMKTPTLYSMRFTRHGRRIQ